ncbi:hypothetical protein PR202_ga17011 [Eleusine coracana subsp. coracana]|uniref:RING-type domain-containing protein n=1 Tax=Eleusine coracana subsp. coracana TaxID=191504 RepID=A0AAV5CPB5_ELECO|nr:hypothetical protein PR202_ga17011 [Eleusine coracana subsp. coracana]
MGELGTELVYRVELSNQTVTYMVDRPGDPLSPEEALKMVKEPEEEEEAYTGHYSGTIPASAEAIAALETSMKEGGCSLCLMDFDTSSKLRVMPCSHYFHEQCIFTWLRHNHVCPLCRFPLATEKHQ